jgi:pimeloyl-ACP methyl ester carboxylesterase
MGAATGVVNVDQSLRLAAFKSGLAPIEPMLRGSPAEFQAVMVQMFDALAGPLTGDDRALVDAQRRADQAVVLGTWETVFTSSEADLDATVAQVGAQIAVPYLAIHGADPGDGYASWLAGVVPSAAVEHWLDHGHYPHLVDKPRFVARLADFAAGLDR